MSNFHTTPTRLGVRPNIPHLPATPESQVLSSPIATNFSSPTPSSYWGTPAGPTLWPPVTSAYVQQRQQPLNNSTVQSNSNILDSNADARNRALQDSGKRGRPRADHISHLILEGTNSPSGIRCRVCSRIFPREKSLQVLTLSYLLYVPYV